MFRHGAVCIHEVKVWCTESAKVRGITPSRTCDIDTVHVCTLRQFVGRGDSVGGTHGQRQPQNAKNEKSSDQTPEIDEVSDAAYRCVVICEIRRLDLEWFNSARGTLRFTWHRLG